MKIVLCNAPWEEKGRYGCRAGSRWPYLTGPPLYVPFPFFLAYATSYLLSNGIDAEFYDAIALGHSTQQFYNNVKNLKPDIILLETSTPSIDNDLKIAFHLSQIAEICLTGPHVSTFAETIIKNSYISYILKGEYELSSLEMCKTRRKGIYEYNHIEDEDFDSLPFPYRDDKHFPYYQDIILGPKTPQLTIAESRGCSFKCKFCLWPFTMYEKRQRTFSNKRILDELEDCNKRFKFNDIFFDSDTFGVCKSEKIIDLSKDIHKFNIPWSVMSRADLHPLEVWLELMSNGCYGFRFGIETFSPKLSKLINKRENLDEALKVIRGLKKAGARIQLCTMGGIPTETEEDKRLHQEGLDEMSRIGVGIQKSWMVPFPGTAYYEELKKQGMDFIDDWSYYSGEESNNRTKEMVDRICREYRKD